jgi:hypothetical protein
MPISAPCPPPSPIKRDEQKNLTRFQLKNHGKIQDISEGCYCSIDVRELPKVFHLLQDLGEEAVGTFEENISAKDIAEGPKCLTSEESCTRPR